MFQGGQVSCHFFFLFSFFPFEVVLTPSLDLSSFLNLGKINKAGRCLRPFLLTDAESRKTQWNRRKRRKKGKGKSFFLLFFFFLFHVTCRSSCQEGNERGKKKSSSVFLSGSWSFHREKEKGRQREKKKTNENKDNVPVGIQMDCSRIPEGFRGRGNNRETRENRYLFRIIHC